MNTYFNDPGNWRCLDKTRPWYQHALKLIDKERDEKILDLGAGNGEFTQILKKINKRVIAADSSLIYCQKLKKKKINCVLADFNKKLPFGNNYFDGVVCLEVIEHIVKAEDFLQEICRILKKNGWLVISTPNISWVGYRWLTLFGQVPFKEGYHLRYFNYYSLKEKLKIAGFDLIASASFTPLPIINRIKQFWPEVKILPNFLAQDLVLKAGKK